MKYFSCKNHGTEPGRPNKKKLKKNNLISHPFSIGVFYVATICLKRTGHERLSRRHERRTLLQSAMRIPKKTKMIITQSKE